MHAVIVGAGPTGLYTAAGWRPPVPPGPTPDELASLVTTAAGKLPRFRGTIRR